MRYLLDTHVLIRWLGEPRRLSKEQTRILQNLVRFQEPVGLSAVTLVELASLSQESTRVSKFNLDKIFQTLESEEMFEILAITPGIARDASRLLPVLRDPVDTFIAATARSHGLQLLTSDARIIASNCVPSVD